jgi:hypothetical protein
MSKNLNPKTATAMNNQASSTRKCCRKRSFTEFATPLKRQYLKEIEIPRGPTIKDLIAAGGDLTNIMSSLCQLTNDIHPIFGDDNICVCPYEETCCMAPHFADNPEVLAWRAKAPQTTSPYIEGFKDNVVVRTTFQLATQMILHDDALPFWAGLMDAVEWGADNANISFKVHPHRQLDQARKERTLRHLENFAANHIRFHFKARHNDDGSLESFEDECEPVRVLDDDPVVATCADAWKYYGWRDGKPTVVHWQQEFSHITMNLAKYLPTRSLEELLSLTVSDLKVRMVDDAMKLCHELAHALEQHNCDHDFFRAPPMNDEIVVETGFSLQSYLFGGVLSHYSNFDGIYLLPWPCQITVDCYKEEGEILRWVRFGDAGPERCLPLNPRQVEVFLEQSFWDDPTPPAGCWKKMWLKPHVEIALDKDDFKYFTTGDTRPYQPQAKRRRLSDATMERQRARIANEGWKKRNAVKFRWHRSKGVSEERNDAFHEREKERLNQFWAGI